MLGAIGVWGPHDSIRLRQLGLTREFAPELEVGRLPSGLQNSATAFCCSTPGCWPTSMCAIQQWQVYCVGFLMLSLLVFGIEALQPDQILAGRSGSVQGLPCLGTTVPIASFDAPCIQVTKARPVLLWHMGKGVKPHANPALCRLLLRP